MIPLILTIAGSDSGGGAGVQADLKSIQANLGFGLSVITAVTAQNTVEVVSAHDLPVEIIGQQIDAVFDDMRIDAVKTGMLSSQAIVEAVADKLGPRKVDKLVVDPVMVSKSGFRLLREEAVLALKRSLLPIAALVTPNRIEAEILSGVDVKNGSDAREAGLRILETGCGAVLVKGGHIDAQQAIDYLVTARGTLPFAGERIRTANTHGTGCTYSAALATWLGHGLELEEAVRRAKSYVTEAIRHGLSIGRGAGPTDHFYFLRKER